MIWLWVAVIVIMLLILMLTSKVKIRVSFTHQEKNDLIFIEVKALFNLVDLRFNIPLLTFKNMTKGIELKTEKVNVGAGKLLADQKQKIDVEKIKQFIEDYKALLQHCFQFNVWFNRMLRRVHCSELDWKTSIGVGDAPETAFLVGTLWGIKSSLIGYVFRLIRLDAQPQLQIMPMFNHTMFMTECTCRLQVRLWHLVSGGVQLLVRILKTKNGLSTWKRVLLNSPKAA